MNRPVLFCLALAFAGGAFGAPPDAPARPKILGVAHISLFVHDMQKARAFYEDFLGYREPFHLDNPDGSLSMAFVKVNERQYIELAPEKQPRTDRLNHISVEVDDADAMRAYLAARGVKVPATVPKGRIGNANFTIRDPDGHGVEFVEYSPGGWSRRERGKFVDGPRISSRIMHLGIGVRGLDAAMKFYGDLLGFQEFWRGSKDGKALSWVNMRVPDGEDYIEFMLYGEEPSLARLGTMHHICLEVPDIDKARAELEQRPARKDYARPLEVTTGVNRRRQMNLYDPDGTRTELMEPRTVDGAAPPPSTAPPPR
ncbi:MAG: VOC family protein [Acidobacteria bacterium]|nr:VOC family protein [Acidobacteriota bacterium]